MDEIEADRLLRNERLGEVFVLGAGFSKAVDHRFPVTDALGHLALAAPRVGMLGAHRWGEHQVTFRELTDAVPPDQSPFLGGSFEAWLSQLAEPQPFLTHVENLANRARFAELARAIWEVLSLIEAEVCRGGLPRWLYRFVATLHARQATVITFNYDRLIEIGLEGLRLQDFSWMSGDEQVRWSDLLDGVPAMPPIPGLFGRDAVSTFRLCKLHGSLNWFWVPDDLSGLTLNRWWLEDGPGRSRDLPGREPFLVPPASAKSAFFANPVMSEIWRRAYEALESAQTACLVGYSMPVTDLTAAGMISKTLAGSPHSAAVVNCDPDPVCTSLAHLTGQYVLAHHSVEEFVEHFVEDASRYLGARCRVASVPDDTRLVVGWNRTMIAKVRTVARHEGGVVLETGEFDGHATTTVQGPDGPDEPALARPFKELAKELRPNDVIVARFPNGQESTIVGIDGFGTSVGASRYWQVLMPADRSEDLGLKFEQRIGVPQ